VPLQAKGNLRTPRARPGRLQPFVPTSTATNKFHGRHHSATEVTISRFLAPAITRSSVNMSSKTSVVNHQKLKCTN